MARKSHLYVLVRNLVYPLLYKLDLVGVRYSYNADIFKKNPPEYVQKNLHDTEMLISQIVQKTYLSGIKLIFLVIPDRIQVYDDLWKKTISYLGVDAEGYNYNRPNEQLKTILKRYGICYVDILPELRNDTNKEYYFYYDGHLNATGHEVAANALFRFILGATGLGCESF